MKVESPAQRRARENAEIRARKVAAEQRRRQAEERFRESVEGPERAQKAEREQEVAWIRDIDPAAADAAKEVDDWKALVRRLEDRDDEQELVRARQHLEDRKARWVMLTATHPRLRHLVSATERDAYGEALRTPLARATADLNEAREQVQRLRADPHASAADVAAAEATNGVAHARWRLELDDSSWEEQRRKKLDRLGLRTPLKPEEQARRDRMRSLEAFIAAKTQEMIAGGMHPDAVRKLRGTP